MDEGEAGIDELFAHPAYSALVEKTNWTAGKAYMHGQITRAELAMTQLLDPLIVGDVRYPPEGWTKARIKRENKRMRKLDNERMLRRHEEFKRRLGLPPDAQ